MIELDRHIEILLLSNDCVIIPNFGGFMAHYVEARTDEKDHAFLPPMRTIGFNPKLILNDSLLAQSYVEAYDISYPDAIARIADEVRELRQHLENDEKYELNDIGVLRLNDNGNLEFEPNVAGLLTPSLYGLSHFNLKTLAQIEREAAEKQQNALAQMVTIAERQPETETARMAVITENDDRPARHHGTTTLWRSVAAACAAVVVFLLVPAPLSNNKPYLAESKINTALLSYVMPKEYTRGADRIKATVEKTMRHAAQAQPTAVPETVASQTTKGFTIVLASKVSKRNASTYVADLHRRGYASAQVLFTKSNNQVVYGNYATRQEASHAMTELRQDKEFGEAWIMKY